MWDLPIRVFHWALAFFFLVAYFLEGDRLRLHSHVGYTVGLLVLFRVIWGVIGSDSARFVNFVVWPWKSLVYLLQQAQGKTSHYIGHNPAGAAMIVLLLTTVMLTVLSGIALFALEGSGPLAGTFVMSWSGGLLEDIHEFSANSCLALVVVHVLGVIFSSYISHENLTKSMFTGYKKESSPKQEIDQESEQIGKQKGKQKENDHGEQS